MNTNRTKIVYSVFDQKTMQIRHKLKHEIEIAKKVIEDNTRKLQSTLDWHVSCDHVRFRDRHSMKELIEMHDRMILNFGVDSESHRQARVRLYECYGLPEVLEEAARQEMYKGAHKILFNLSLEHVNQRIGDEFISRCPVPDSVSALLKICQYLTKEEMNSISADFRHEEVNWLYTTLLDWYLWNNAQK